MVVSHILSKTENALSHLFKKEILSNLVNIYFFLTIGIFFGPQCLPVEFNVDRVSLETSREVMFYRLLVLMLKCKGQRTALTHFFSHSPLKVPHLVC